MEPQQQHGPHAPVLLVLGLQLPDDGADGHMAVRGDVQRPHLRPRLHRRPAVYAHADPHPQRHADNYPHANAVDHAYAVVSDRFCLFSGSDEWEWRVTGSRLAY